jgi:hypothetical protein
MKQIDIKTRKHTEALERNAKWEALSFEAQLKQLDTMFGQGLGAAKQRAKIAKKINVRDSKVKK